MDGDQASMFKVQKILGVCRAILSDPRYKTLGFEPPFVMNRHVENIESPKPKNSDLKSVVMARLPILVRLPENVELLTASLIEGYDTQVKLAETDKGYKFVGDNYQ